MQAYRIDPAEHGGMVSTMTEALTMKVPEAARVLGISRGHAYAAAADGTLPTIRIGRRLLVPRAALERLLDLDREAEAAGKSGKP
jgi:excisionase family DNA binding protein